MMPEEKSDKDETTEKSEVAAPATSAGSSMSSTSSPPAAPALDPNPAATQVELARVRTLLALDRTLMAWIRTSLSLLAFGFTLARFVHDLIASKSIPNFNTNSPKMLGLTLMVVGVLGLVCGVVDHVKAVSKLKGDITIAFWSAPAAVALFLALMSILIIFDLVNSAPL